MNKLSMVGIVICVFSVQVLAGPPIIDKEFKDWKVLGVPHDIFAMSTSSVPAPKGEQWLLILEAQIATDSRTLSPFFYLYDLAGCNDQSEGKSIPITMSINQLSISTTAQCHSLMLNFLFDEMKLLIDEANDTSPLTLTSPNFKQPLIFSMRGSQEALAYEMGAPNNFSLTPRRHK